VDFNLILNKGLAFSACSLKPDAWCLVPDVLVCSGWPTPPSEVKALILALALVAMDHRPSWSEQGVCQFDIKPVVKRERRAKYYITFLNNEIFSLSEASRKLWILHSLEAIQCLK